MVCLAGFAPSARATDTLTAGQILHTIDDIMIPENSKMTVVQTIETSGGGTRNFTYVGYSTDSNEKSIIRYEKPIRVKDQAWLMLNNGDDIWAYFPRTRRIRKLASHARKNKLMGSDFTFEDIGSGTRYEDEYTPKRLPDKKLGDIDCKVIELTPKPDKDPSYKKLICYVRPGDLYPIRIDYYEKVDQLTKILNLDDIRDIEGRPTSMHMVMHNQEDGSQTSMTIKKVTYKVTFPSDFFTERNLKP